jgi:hypothetical protein
MTTVGIIINPNLDRKGLLVVETEQGTLKCEINNDLREDYRKRFKEELKINMTVELTGELVGKEPRRAEMGTFVIKSITRPAKPVLLIKAAPEGSWLSVAKKIRDKGYGMTIIWDRNGVWGPYTDTGSAEIVYHYLPSEELPIYYTETLERFEDRVENIVLCFSA